MVRSNEGIYAQMTPREMGGSTTMFYVEIQGAIIPCSFPSFQKTSLGLLRLPIYFNLRLLSPVTYLFASTNIEKIREKQRYFKKNELY